MKGQILIFISVLLLAACSPSKNIAKSAKQKIINDKALTNAHVGICIFEPSTGKYLYNYQGDKYFVPASNTKIPTCYAAMKYLGDSLVGLKYGYSEPDSEVLVLQPTGDPTFLHADFVNQPVWNFMVSRVEKYKRRVVILDTVWKDERWGSGWSWNDYDEYYMAEKSSMPVFGNVVEIKLRQPDDKVIDEQFRTTQRVFKTRPSFFDRLVNLDLGIPVNLIYWNNDSTSPKNGLFRISRDINDNRFEIKPSEIKFSRAEIPFVTEDPLWHSSTQTTKAILADTLGYQFGLIQPAGANGKFSVYDGNEDRNVAVNKWMKIYSRPTDSLLEPMMHRSDNFFAEQSLLMVSNEVVGIMNDAKIIETLLKTDFKDLPQKPYWVDGCGLSRYNLFTPQDMVAILNKMQSEFGMERIKTIFATGGEGTLRSYYKDIQGFIYAKTGTLTGVVALSGFLYTKKNKLLIFSVLVNNHNGSATEVRRAVEKFIGELRDNN